ncbi:hypothetical protein TanjilG_04965 [Lupinus angustifolius]|uniref:Uncharacterized protein n=1 Tax=Lupinus angustifolius TaxID=3871 RepID=A0A394DEQ9_LUPAN|nr:hypothetical protein TanjilG_04965 [Lupinus angustifolius]
MTAFYPSPESSDNSRRFEHSPAEECGRLDPLGLGPRRSQGQCRVVGVGGYWWHKVEEVAAVAATAPPYGERWGVDKEEGGEVQECGNLLGEENLDVVLHGDMKMV